MTTLLDELEIRLEQTVRTRMSYNYLTRTKTVQYLYEDFANWLVTKFEDEEAE